ncbi:hypothetical protein [uncultured Winogradskyella sp.]|uniref:hypothetical protein n=1 Tax=uncultured Winogradskyella sp. TaxID=395353 RepID=UPI00262EDF56|nr:hypothetical protein [uncultured Winogradskyella sp.]
MLFTILFNSCQNEPVFENNSDLSIYSDDEVKVTNNRLHFNSLETLTTFYDIYKNESEEILFEFVEPFYSKGFFSLRPPITETNEDYIYDLILKVYDNSDSSNQKKSNINENKNGNSLLDSIDELEDLIGDDAFAAFLNNNAEIQIDNKIYKYTDVGLFVVPVDNFTLLEVYLDQKSISKNPLVKTNGTIALNHIKEKTTGTLAVIEPSIGVEYSGCNQGLFVEDSFCNNLVNVLTMYDPDLENGSGGSSSGVSNGSTPTQPLDGLEAFVNNLEACNSSSGLFGSLFGTNKVCIDKYESDKRVKTKAYNYDYFVVVNTGVKVKHQKKGWTGIWRKQDVSVMVMGSPRVQYNYDFDSVIASVWSGLNLFESRISSSDLGKQWTFNTTLFSDPYGTWWAKSETNYVNTPYPTAVHDDFVIETFKDNVAIDWALDQVNKQLTKEELNKFFWQQARNATKTLVKEYLTGQPDFEVPLNRTLISKKPNYGKVLVQKSVYQDCLNCKKLDKTFEFSVVLEASTNPDDNWSLSGGVDDSLFYEPKDYSVSLYGAVKVGNQWHGSLIDF